MKKTNKKKLNESKFYIKFEGETWDEAIEAYGHPGGSDTLEDAIYEANLDPDKSKYVIFNNKLEIVHKGRSTGSQYEG